MQFKARFNTTRHALSLHSYTCAQAQPQRKERDPRFDVVAVNAPAAVAQLEEDHECKARGIKITVCACCKA